MTNLNPQLKKKMGLEPYDAPGKCWLCPADHVFNPKSGTCEIFCHFETKLEFGIGPITSRDSFELDIEADIFY